MIFLIIFCLLITNAHFLLADQFRFLELQPNPFFCLAIYLIFKGHEKSVFKHLFLVGALADLFYFQKFGVCISIFLFCGWLLVDSRSMLFVDHFFTHVIFVFAISLISMFIVYLVKEGISLRAPLFIAIYNAMITPIFFYLFKWLKLDKVGDN